MQADSRPTLPHRRSTGDGGGDRLTARQSRASRAAASELGRRLPRAERLISHLVRRHRLEMEDAA